MPANGHSNHSMSNGGMKTPETPQDEALAFFSLKSHDGGEPVQVWELVLEDDGGPGESKSVSASFWYPIKQHSQTFQTYKKLLMPTSS